MTPEHQSRRVITISRKKWGKSAAKTEKAIRDAIPKPDDMESINKFITSGKSFTCYDLANRFNIRMSVAKRILREAEADGKVTPYIRESGFVVYTTPSEIEKREGGAPIMVADVLAEVAASKPPEPIITEDMEAQLAAASMGVVKPSKLARKRREAGEKKERKDKRPEVVVEPLESEVEKETPPEPPKTEKKEEKPKKKPAKREEKKEETPKKKPAKREEKKEETPKKKPAKKEEKKEETPKKKPAKKEEKKEETPKKKAEPKPKKTETKKTPKKETKKKVALTDIPGVGPKTAEDLKAAGITTVAKLSKFDPVKLSEKVDGIGETSAKSMIDEAKKLA